MNELFKITLTLCHIPMTHTIALRHYVLRLSWRKSFLSFTRPIRLPSLPPTYFNLNTFAHYGLDLKVSHCMHTVNEAKWLYMKSMKWLKWWPDWVERDEMRDRKMLGSCSQDYSRFINYMSEWRELSWRSWLRSSSVSSIHPHQHFYSVNQPG